MWTARRTIHVFYMKNSQFITECVSQISSAEELNDRESGIRRGSGTSKTAIQREMENVFKPKRNRVEGTPVKLATMDDILTAIQALEITNYSECLSLEGATRMFRGFNNGKNKSSRSANEYVPIIFSLVKNFFSAWDPLNERAYGVSIMKEWRVILEDSFTPEKDFDLEVVTGKDVYERLLSEEWIPHIRNAVSRWNFNKPDLLIDILDIWFLVVPHSVKQHILTDLVFPRLCEEIHKWDPELNFIHENIHPWIPVFGEQMGHLYDHVYLRLVRSAEEWHPTDSFLMRSLRPWAKLFPRELIEDFTVKIVLPRVNEFMEEMVVLIRIPRKGLLNLWQSMIQWKEFIPLNCLVLSLETHFFPKFIKVLFKWLELKPELQDVYIWYLKWRKIFPSDLLRHPAIKNSFDQAANLIDQESSKGDYFQR